MLRRSSEPKKRRTREHVIADLGVNFVERQVLLAGHTVERRVHDYGIDMVLCTYDEDGEEERGEVFFQVKATDHIRTVDEGRFIAVRIERAHLRTWLVEPMPVVLIVYDAISDCGYWFYVQASFSGAKRFQAARGSERMTIRIPSSHFLDTASVRRFQSFRQAVLEQIQGVIHQDV